MTSSSGTPSALSPLKRALLALQELRARLESVEAASREPIAIVGAGCRFPGGVADLASYWQLLHDGVDAIREIPTDRWDVDAYYDPDPATPGKMAVRSGGFLESIDRFDANFFGISPREAVSMDPQQRLLLEVGWEALETAGIAAEDLQRTQTGVFIGICSNDYLRHHLAEPDQLDAYSSSGNAHSVAAGRLSYTLGLQGPCMAVDTACSSSLVAVHLAVQSLRRGECDAALAGGVNLILAPDGTVALSQAQMLAPDGRCRAFDAAAAGYGRSEGCGIVVLKRLRDAVRDQDRILAVIRGTAVNQDGRSNGLTAPNGIAQQAVIRAALADGGVDAAEVSYVETHGTGTVLGDPMEVDALQSVLCHGRRPDRPLLIGSVKTNLGHLETAAGIAGLLKASLALKNREIPPHIHLQQPSPHIPWHQLPIAVPTEPVAWQGSPIAGVSSFGYSGTNAHVVLEAAPERASHTAAEERPGHLLTLSARHPESLRELGDAFVGALSTPRASLADICYTANACRSHFPYRLAVTGADASDVREKLQGWAAGDTPKGLHQHEHHGTEASRIGFLFTGQGAQYAGMGRQLYESQPVFRATLDRCCEILAPLLDRPLLDVMWADDDDAHLIDRTDYTQPALFALEFALATMWQAWGIKPAALLGHSVGEYVAACLAGVFSLEDGLKLVAARGRLMQQLGSEGAMAAVFAPESRVSDVIASRADRLSIAAINGPAEVVISGKRAAVQDARDELVGAGIRVRPLTVSQAFHSPLLDPMLDDFAAIAGKVRYSQPTVVVISNRTGSRAEALKIATPEYWVRQTREAVRFADGIGALAEEGCTAFLEIGPQATLLHLAKENLPELDAAYSASLRRGQDDWNQLLDSLATLYVWGADVDWAGFDRGCGRERKDIPLYSFRRQRYWPEQRQEKRTQTEPRLHPLVERCLTLPLQQQIFECRLSPDSPAFLADHRIQGMAVAPGAAYVELALMAAEAIRPGPHVLEEVSFQEPLVLSDADGERLDIVFTPDSSTFQIFHRTRGDENPESKWRMLAGGRIGAAAFPVSPPPLAAIRERCSEAVDVDAYYRRLARLGLDYGPLLRGIRSIGRGEREILADVNLPDALDPEIERYRFHPALLDACLQTLGATAIDSDEVDLDHSFVLAGITRFSVYRTPDASVLVHARLQRQTAGSLRGDILILDESGEVIAAAEGVRVQRVSGLDRAELKTADWMYDVAWETRPVAAFPAAPAETAPSFPADLERIRSEHDLDRYEALQPQFDALAGAWARSALRDLGWEPVKTPADLGISPDHGQLFERIVQMCIEDEALGRRLDTDPKSLHADLLERFPTCAAELTLLRRCGEHLAAVLRGELDALPVLFPGGSLDMLEKAYTEEPFAGAGNAVLQEAMGAAIENRPADQPIRILEIGAGTGGTTACLLPGLAADRVEYTFTDVSQLFLRRGKEKFRAYEFVEYRLLDIERDPNGQGLAGRQFDIVVAANVLHATSDLKKTLCHVRQLLASDGQLMLLEGTARQRKTDLIFGLTPGWWQFQDRELRPTHALLPVGAWLNVLRETGFGDADAVPDPDTTVASAWSVIVTRPVTASWLLIGDGDGLAERLSSLLRGRGETVSCIANGSRDIEIPDECRGVVFLGGLDDQDQEKICGTALRLIQQTARMGRGSTPVWMITRGAQPAAGTVSERGVSGATLWGLGRVLANEHPEMWGALIDLDPAMAPSAQAESILDTLSHPDPDRQVAFRAGTRFVPRLVRRADAVGPAVELRDDATYLVTGGTGGLGLLVARWLVERGARNLVLCSRHAPSDEAREAIKVLSQAGTEMLVSQTDVADPERVAELLRQIAREMPPLRGVIHAAGTYDDGVLLQQTWERFTRVLAPKVAGAWNLHTLTAEIPLDFFVLFSSASALFGARGQANYAAANAYLDALGRYRYSIGLPATVVNWGPWAETGEAARLDDAANTRYATQGIAFLPPTAALACLGFLIGENATQTAVLSVRWRLYLRQFGDSVPALFEHLAAEVPTAGVSSADDWRARIGAARASERAAVLETMVREQVGAVLRIDSTQQLSAREPLQSLGIDSLMAVELRNNLAKVTDRSLSSTLVFDYPTIEAIAGFLLTQEWPDVVPMPSRQPEALPSVRAEPIAIIGAACRIPGGANDLDSFWQMLLDGTDAIAEVPAERWDIDAYYDPDPDAAGKMYTRWGGFLGPVDEFDATFFGITPREAIGMDPQQRLLLETSWEALENAGQAPHGLLGSQTGVFVGISSYDYYHLQRAAVPGAVDAYTGSGVTFSVAAGRLAYVLGLQGPTMAVDTACSSSLVTTHLACQSLRGGECDLALAGGVNLILSPENTIYSCRLHALAADGRCKTFDAAANGYVRGEGCGMVVLKRLSDAVRDGDPILALIRGSAVNQDGRSNGLTAPNGPAQEAVIRAALASGGVRPDEVSYVEAHGTGTPLGDPIELQALGAVLGSGHTTERPLVVGSLKTNIGHLESAAGITSLIKAALVVKHGEIPPHLHLQERNPYIPWDDLPVLIPSETMPWPDPDSRRFAGVSSFGYSGTNAHVVLEEPPALPVADAAADREELLLLSARSADALDTLARAYRDTLASTTDSLRDITYTAAVRRSHHEHRLALTGSSREDLIRNLESYLDGRADAGVSHGVTDTGDPGRVVFVFPGQGSQWLGMGRNLLESEPVFRTMIEQCDLAIRAEAGWSVLEELTASETESRLGEINVAQPVLFAIQVALAAQWRAWGIHPDAVVGHSMGEVAAAHAAGALSLDDATRIICRRSQLLTRIAGRGAMAVVELSAAEAERAVGGVAGVDVAAGNSARSTVLSGDSAGLQSVLEELEARGVFCRRVKVDVASHSPYVDELREPLLQALAEVTPRPTDIPMYSTVEGEPIDGTRLGASYWVRNLRKPVQFGPVMERLLTDGHRLFIEVSPHPVLLPSMEDTFREADSAGRAFGSLHRDEPERWSILSAIGALYALGRDVDFSALYPDGTVVGLPTYRWDRQRYWITDHAGATPLVSTAASSLGTHLESAVDPGTHLWEQELSLDAVPYLRDHLVQGLAVLPATAYLDLALTGAAEAFGTPVTVGDVVFDQMLAFPEDVTHRVQLAISGDETGATFRILSAGESWTLHAHGTLRPSTVEAGSGESIAAIQARCPEVSSGGEIYERLAASGLGYGPAFQGIEQVWSGHGEALGMVHLPQHMTGTSTGLHPALLDSCFQVMGMAIGAADEERVYVPTALASLQFAGGSSRIRWSYVRLKETGPNHRIADICLLDESGRTIAEARGLEVRALEPEGSGDAVADRWLYHVRWEASPAPPKAEGLPGRWLILADRHGIGESLAEQLEARGDACELIVEVGPTGSSEDFRPLLTREHAWTGIVHLWSLDHEASDDWSSTLSALHLVQALAATGRRDNSRIWLVTRGAQAVEPDDTPATGQSPLWGLGRTIPYEHPEFGCTLVDLGRHETDETALLNEILSMDREDQIALRGDRRYVARLERWQASADDAVMPAGDRPFRLAQQTPGVLDGLTLEEFDCREPGAGEVRIEVRATGLNFLDVLLALGVIPDDQESTEAIGLGSECAGRIVALGDGVTGFEPGDDVIAIAPRALGSHVITNAALVAAKPGHLSPAEAATIPIAFLTAWYALRHVAHLMPGERVLIHAAAGGVGMAAVQIAQFIGAEIFATAGSGEKRDRLRSVGVERVMDSRSLAFAGEVRAANGGEGIDVVLNSLSGEFIDASLDLLTDHGRYVEIGKRDYYANRALGLKPFLRNLSFSLVDLRSMIVKRPCYVRELLDEVLELFESNQLRPLPYTTFEPGDMPDAFHWMAQAKHIGKIVIAWDGKENVPIAAGAVVRLRSDRSYAITGGLGGLGLLTARWLIEQGARQVALLGRSVPSPEAMREIVSLRDLGASVEVFQTDVADWESMQTAFDAVERSMSPPAGIIHAAGVLDDGLLTHLTSERFSAVAAPKIDGAWNLHRLTKDRQLDLFVMYSSGSSVLGAPGQANYAAANAFLDALASFRRGQGLPALSINWGAWADVGLAAAQANRGERLAMRGFASIPPADGLRILGRLLAQNPIQVAVLPLNLRQWQQSYPQLADVPLMRGVMGQLSDAPSSEKRGLRSALVAAPASERAAIMEAHVQEQVARVVRLDAGRVEPRVSFQSLGLDSLMALELRNRLEAIVGLTLPATVVWGYPNVAALSAHLVAALNLPVPTREPEDRNAPGTADEARTLERVSDLSDDEVDRLLAARVSARDGTA